ncbi:fad-binding domain-containing protein [Diplodia corticola]|uniref:Delta(24)-sterol reductase n=1 Tax=Diplodia corticola TaxID=236234 RepID=A0A1J9RXY9_9PEZI|nr:fad-binding domain-containing protein [Diplodia corticola]OJD37515.1 fad-binding domain-containing protein [Diplodia corticola]
MDQHNDAVKAIASQVEDFYKRKEPFRIYHGSTNSTRIVQFDRKKMVDMSSFNHVLEVDRHRQVALVQPNVPMDALAEETLKYGLIPPVVMEFPGITTGGGFSGVAGESSSWRWGFFDRIVNWCHVILPTGEIAKASPTENEDLFYGAPGTYGTLCVTTLFEIQLIPAQKFVELEYVTVDSVPSAVQTLQRAMAEEKHEYIDGIMFSLKRGTIMLGKMTDGPSSPSIKPQRFSRAWDQWFYLHADAVTKPGKPNHVEAVPLADYLFRYDRGAFWTGRYAFRRFHTPFDRLSRLVLDRLMHTRRMYAALNASGFTQQYIIQDLALPFDAAEAFIGWVDRAVRNYPLWLCPLRVENAAAVPLRARIGGKIIVNAEGSGPAAAAASSSSPADSGAESGGGGGAAAEGGDGPQFLLNVGVWGPGPRKAEPFVRLNRELEAEVRRLGGFKWLYANAYYTEDEFWQIYDKGWYDGLRKKYRAETLPSVYDKVKAKEERVPISGLRGIKTAMFGGTSGKHLFGK